MNRHQFVPYADSVPNGKVIKVYFINGDQKELIDSSYENGKVVFETNHFSTYALYLENAPSNGFPIIYVIIGAVAAIGLIAAAIIVKKHI